MAKTQTRKCVSISGETYDRVSAHCKEQGSSISGFVETLAAEFFRNETMITNSVPEKEKKVEKGNDVREKEPAPTPFVYNGVKKESPQGTKKDPIRGGGIHSL